MTRSLDDPASLSLLLLLRQGPRSPSYDRLDTLAVLDLLEAGLIEFDADNGFVSLSDEGRAFITRYPGDLEHIDH